MEEAVTVMQHEERKRVAYMVRDGLIKPQDAQAMLGLGIRQMQRVLRYYEVYVPPTKTASRNLEWEKKRLHKEAAKAMVTTHGSLKVLAEQTGFSWRTLYRWKQEELARLKANS